MDLASIDHLLTTTRSVRKRLDFTRPVEPEIIEKCLEIAIQAPTASNRQHWHFLIVTDAEKRATIGRYYKEAFEQYRGPRREQQLTPTDPYQVQMARVIDSARYLAEHMHEVPIMVIPCIEGRPESPAPTAQAGLYGSILPATWSLMLALRARGLGSAWTTLHLRYEKEVAHLLDIPDNITQAALLPIAYFKGSDFKPANRRPAEALTYWNVWGKRR